MQSSSEPGKNSLQGKLFSWHFFVVLGLLLGLSPVEILAEVNLPTFQLEEEKTQFPTNPKSYVKPPRLDLNEASKPVFDPEWFDRQHELRKPESEFEREIRKERIEFAREQLKEKRDFFINLRKKNLSPEKFREKTLEFHADQKEDATKFGAKVEKKLKKSEKEERGDELSFKINEIEVEKREFLEGQRNDRIELFKEFREKGVAPSESIAKIARFDEKQRKAREDFFVKQAKKRQKVLEKG